MIGYVTLGTNDLPRAARFYDEIMPMLGQKRVMENERYITWGTDMSAPMLCAIMPFDGNAASVGNGTMVALAANSKETVDRVYARAIALGAKDEGAAGPRGEGFYGGYFRDMDGNKLAVFCIG